MRAQDLVLNGFRATSRILRDRGDLSLLDECSKRDSSPRLRGIAPHDRSDFSLRRLGGTFLSFGGEPCAIAFWRACPQLSSHLPRRRPARRGCPAYHFPTRHNPGCREPRSSITG